MSKGKKYDEMVRNPQNDLLGFFENYSEIMTESQAYIQQLNPSQIYDLGCGTGNLCGELSKSFNVYGVDQSPEMLEVLQEKYPNVKTLCMPFEEALVNAQVDAQTVIASSFVLHAVQDKTSCFEAFTKAMRLGAKIIVVDYMFDSIEEKQKFANSLVENGQKDLAEIILKKAYLTLDQVKAWADKDQLQMEVVSFTDKIKRMTFWNNI